MKKFLILGFGLILMTTGCQKKNLSEALLSNDPDKRGKALVELTKISDNDLFLLIPPLVSTLQSVDSQKVSRAIDALSVIGKSAVPELISSLRTNNVPAQIASAQTLGLIGRPAMKAVPDLKNLLKNGHPLAKEEAAQALERIRPSNKSIEKSAGF